MFNPFTKYIDRKLEQRMVKVAQSSIKMRSLLERAGGYTDSETMFSPENREDYLYTYRKYIWVYASVYAIATNCAKVPFRIYKLDGNNEKSEELKNGRLWNLFNRPNPFQSYFDILEANLSCLELTGCSYTEKIGVDPLVPEQQLILRPDWMEIIPDSKTLYGGFDYKVSGKHILYTPDEICYMKYYNPLSELYGQSALEPSSPSIVLDTYTQKYQKNYFKNGAMLSSYVTVPKSLGDVEYKRFKEQLNANYGGVEKSHMLGVFDNDAKFVELGTNPDKILLSEQRANNRNEVLAAFGIPPIMVSVMDSSTFNNALEQKKAFWENTAMPKLQKIQDKWNQEFCLPFGYEGEFDFKNIPALQEDQQKKAITAKVYVDGGIITVNEARKDFLNKEPLEGGDTLKSLNANPYPFQNMALADKTKELQKAKDNYRQEQDIITAEYFNNLKPIFDDITNTVIQTVKLNYGLKKVYKLSKSGLINSVVDALDDKSNEILDVLIATHEEQFLDAMKGKYQGIKKTPMPSDILNKAKQQAKKNAEKWSKESLKSISETMQNRLVGYLTESTKNETDIDTLTEGIQDIFKGTTRGEYPQAMAIARTESQKALNSGKFQGIKSAGIKYKEWISVDDERSRPDHAELGKIGPVPLDYLYETDNGQLLFPGDPNGNVADLVNCRDTITESFSGPEDEEVTNEN